MLIEVNLKLVLPPSSILLYTNNFLSMEAQLLVDYLYLFFWGPNLFFFNVKIK